jgi:hypothetical protein
LRFGAGDDIVTLDADALADADFRAGALAMGRFDAATAAGFLAATFFAGTGFGLDLVVDAAVLCFAPTVFSAFLAGAAFAAFGRTVAILRLALFATVVSIRRKF